jgi:flagellum-specific ATP synthase
MAAMTATTTPAATTPHTTAWLGFLRDCDELAALASPLKVTGHLTRVAGLVMEAVGLQLAVGANCEVILPSGTRVEAEVVGFSGEKIFLMPSDDVYGLTPGATVVPVEIAQKLPVAGESHRPRRRVTDRAKQLPVGEALLGRVLDGMGRPLDSLGPVTTEQSASLAKRPYNPLERAAIVTPLDVGVRSINALLTVGRGQRMGLFAGSGVGKSVLLGMMARYTSADVIVVGLIGERGREVKEFIEHILGAEGLARSVVVAAPADTSPMMRLQGASYATAVAEYFRDRGKHVLLIMDSLTRYAMAQREIALAIGEPPATKGYPPSVFARLPQLVERAGNGPQGGGSITAFYTVLTEGDDQQDPIADAARAILDGHIVLSRELAEQAHYPAIDIESSISRAMTSLISPGQFEQTRRFKRLYSRYRRNRELITVGAYQPGTDAVLDEAIAAQPRFEAFLQQDMASRENYADSVGKLTGLFR